MPTTKPLYKSTIVIWSDYDPTFVELESLAAQAVYGDAYCSKLIEEVVQEPTLDPDWDGTEFFDEGDI